MDAFESLQTGFGKVDYTPDFPVGLAGYGGDFARRNTEIVSKVYITCIAARQKDTTILLYTVDTCCVRLMHAQRFRTAIEAAVGVPETNIFFGATHGHNCPSMVPEKEPSVAETLDLMERAVVQAAKTAIEDLAQTQIQAAKPTIPDMNFTRHYRLANGVRASANAGMMRKDDPIVGYLGPNDPQMMLVRFVREDKQDIILMNWQAHPDDAKEIGFSSIASGFIGPARDELEALSGCHVAYFTGAAGNQVHHSWLSEPANELAYDEYGKKLGQLAFAAFDQLQPVTEDGIQTARTMLQVAVNHTEDHKVAQAQDVVDHVGTLEKDELKALYKSYGFGTVAHARGVLMRAKMEATQELELNAFRIGPIAFANNTCETMSDQGLHIKAYSPYEYTFMVTGCRGYLASKQIYDYKAYEALGGSANYVRGTAEEMADKLLELLTQLQ